MRPLTTLAALLLALPAGLAHATLQKLHRDLVAPGSRSLVPALQAGMRIEDMDIADLHALLALPQANAHVRLLAQKLLKGSRNHLRAFARTLADGKAAHKAQHLEQAELDRIAASEHECCVVYDANHKPLEAPAGCSARGPRRAGGAMRAAGCAGGCGSASADDAEPACRRAGKEQGQGEGHGPGRG